MTATKFASITPKQVSAMSGPELLALYNKSAEFVGAPIVKRFASLTVGYTRTVKMLAQAVEREAAGVTFNEEPALAAVTVTAEAVQAKVKANPKAAIAKKKAPVGAKVWEKKEDGSCPKCNAPAADITPAGLEGTAAEHRNLCHHCGLEWDVETGKEYKKPIESGKRSAIIAESWKSAETRAKRAERTGVKVTGGNIKGVAEYPSVRTAFIGLGLPLAKHIAFRMALKAHGEITIDKFTFEAVDKSKPKAEKKAKGKK